MNSTSTTESTKGPENPQTTIILSTLAPTEMQTTISETSKLSPLTNTNPENTVTEINLTSTEKPASDKIENTARTESTDQVTDRQVTVQISDKVSTSTPNTPMIPTEPTIELTTSKIPVKPSTESTETTVLVTLSMQTTDTIEKTTEKVISTSLKASTVDVNDKIDDILEFTTIVSLLEKFQAPIKPNNYSQSVFSG